MCPHVDLAPRNVHDTSTAIPAAGTCTTLVIDHWLAHVAMQQAF